MKGIMDAVDYQFNWRFAERWLDAPRIKGRENHASNCKQEKHVDQTLQFRDRRKIAPGRQHVKKENKHIGTLPYMFTNSCFDFLVPQASQYTQN